MTRARALPWLALALTAASACSSTLWYGHSPDRRHRVEAIARGGEQRIRRDSRLGPAFEAIGVAAIRFSPDSRRLAYPARRDGGWTVVLDGVPGPRWDGIGELRFSPDSRRLAYAAQRGSRWLVVCDGRPDGIEAEALLAGSLTFSADGRRLAYVTVERGARRVVVDRRPGRGYAAIGKLAFDAGRLRYLARGPRGVRLVIEGSEGPPFEAIGELAAASGRSGYLARSRSGWAAVIDGETGPPNDELRALRFSDDGRHVAYVARQGSRARVVLDGTPGPLHDGVRFATLGFTRRGDLLYVARDAGRYRVVHGGAAGPPHDAIEQVATGPHGDRWGYIARRGRRYLVVVDGAVIGTHGFAADLVFGSAGSPHYVVARGDRRAVVHRGHEHALDLYVEGTLRVSRDGEHWACLAGDRRRRELFVSIDGIWTRPFDLQELVAEVSRGADRAGLLRRWIAAELELGIPR